MVTEDNVRETLKNVVDPEIGLDIVNLGLVYNVVVDEKTVNIDMTLTSPACPAGPQIIGQAQTVLKDSFPEVDEVKVNLVWTPFWNPKMMSQEAKDELGFYE